jgi:hypothetical protein
LGGIVPTFVRGKIEFSRVVTQESDENPPRV